MINVLPRGVEGGCGGRRGVQRPTRSLGNTGILGICLALALSPRGRAAAPTPAAVVRMGSCASSAGQPKGPALEAAAATAVAPVRQLAEAGGQLSRMEDQVRSWAEPRHGSREWYQVHEAHKGEVHSHLHAGSLCGGLLWYGDSITESLRGVAWGSPSPRCLGIDAVFEEAWKSRYCTEAFGISADETKHLAWRLLHGEGPSGLGAKVAVLMIGVNELQYMPEEPTKVERYGGEVAGRVQQIVQLLLEQDPKLHVVVQGLLPVGTSTALFSRTRPCLQAINKSLREFANSSDLAIAARVSYVYCGDKLLVEGGGRVDARFAPDGLHPSAEGWSRISECLLPIVRPLMEREE